MASPSLHKIDDVIGKNKSKRYRNRACVRFFWIDVLDELEAPGSQLLEGWRRKLTANTNNAARLKGFGGAYKV
jgi:hypothetical protein